jgi:hypothetical protein
MMDHVLAWHQYKQVSFTVRYPKMNDFRKKSGYLIDESLRCVRQVMSDEEDYQESTFFLFSSNLKKKHNFAKISLHAILLLPYF